MTNMQPKTTCGSFAARLERAAFLRLAGRLAMAMALLVGAAGTAAAQNGDLQALKAPRDVTFTTKDRINLVGTYFESNVGRESPVVIFLHRQGGDRLEWTKGIASNLQRAGFAVVTVDLRGHGQSRTDDGQNKGRRRRSDTVKLVPQDYKNMVAFDCEAVKKFIFDEHQAGRLNMNKTGIVGAEMGAAVAVWYALYDWQKDPHPDGIGADRTPRGQDIRALALLTPENVPGLPYPAPLNKLRDADPGIWLMVACSTGDRAAAREAEKIYDMFNKSGQNQDRSFLQLYPGELKGASLLGRPELKVDEHLTTFLTKSLKSLPANWRDRQSKLLK